MMFAVYACILGLSWLGTKMIVVDDLTTGELMSLLTYCMNKIKKGDLRRSMGIVLQDTNLFTATVMENIRY